MAFRIVESKKNKVLSIQYGKAVAGSKLALAAAEGRGEHIVIGVYVLDSMV